MQEKINNFQVLKLLVYSNVVLFTWIFLSAKDMKDLYQTSTDTEIYKTNLYSIMSPLIARDFTLGITEETCGRRGKAGYCR